MEAEAARAMERPSWTGSLDWALTERHLVSATRYSMSEVAEPLRGVPAPGVPARLGEDKALLRTMCEGAVAGMIGLWVPVRRLWYQKPDWQDGFQC